MTEIKSESRLTFLEATSIIVGHGVGSGILAVPYLASRNSWLDLLWIIPLAYGINLVMHFMIAELSLNNGGAQFIACFQNELFTGRAGKALTWFAFAMLGLSVLMNVSGFIVGSAAVFTAWFGMPEKAAVILYYVLAASVVFIGMKAVGICEKISVFAMIGVIGILFVAVLLSPLSALPVSRIAVSNVLALYGMVAFSLSSVMSVPQVVKGLNGDVRRIRASIAAGTGINAALIVLITFMTLLGAGTSISGSGALVDLSAHLGGWVSIVGYVFSLLALSTSFWANTLNLRDIVHEQTGLRLHLSWLISTLPCLLLSLVGLSSFVGFTRLAGIIQVLTGLAIIVAYGRSRRRTGTAPVSGRFGTLPFQVLVLLGSVAATAGSMLHIK